MDEAEVDLSHWIRVVVEHADQARPPRAADAQLLLEFALEPGSHRVRSAFHVRPVDVAAHAEAELPVQPRFPAGGGKAVHGWPAEQPRARHDQDLLLMRVHRPARSPRGQAWEVSRSNS